MDKKYTKWLHWDITRKCNFNCEYCFYQSGKGGIERGCIDIPLLIKKLRDAGEKYRIGFTGGEPFLAENFVELCEGLTTEGHTISINTNLSLDKIEDFCSRIKPEMVKFVHASFHYRELRAKNKLGQYFGNYKRLVENSFPVYAEMVLYPGDFELIEEIKGIFNKYDVKLKAAPFIGYYNNLWYPDSYSDAEKKKYGINEDQLEIYSQRGEICNAGYNVAIVDTDGDVRACFNSSEKMGNIYEGINWRTEPIICQHKKCGCPMNVLDKSLNDFFWR